MARFIRKHTRRRTNSEQQIDNHHVRDTIPRNASQQDVDHTVEEDDQNETNANGERAETPVVIHPEVAPLVTHHQTPHQTPSCHAKFGQPHSAAGVWARRDATLAEHSELPRTISSGL